jgi:hypothetical protein
MDFEKMMDMDGAVEKPSGAKGMCAHCGQPLIGKLEIEVEQKDDSEDMKEAGESYAESDEPESGDEDKEGKKQMAIAILKKKLVG